MPMNDRALAPAEAAQLLRATLELLRSALLAIPAPLLTARPGPRDWCINEVLGHLIEAEERGFAGRIRAIVAADEPDLVGWDQEEVAAARGDCEREVLELLDDFVGRRQESVKMVSGLSLSDLDRGGMHSAVGRLTVGELLHEWVYHDQVHVSQIAGNLQRLVWGHMGNAKRFYGG